MNDNAPPALADNAAEWHALIVKRAEEIYGLRVYGVAAQNARSAAIEIEFQQVAERHGAGRLSLDQRQQLALRMTSTMRGRVVELLKAEVERLGVRLD